MSGSVASRNGIASGSIPINEFKMILLFHFIL